MPQSPILADQLQVEPGSTGTRLVRRAADGSLEFVDPLNAAGITLSKLAGLQSVAGVLVVGKSGAGAEYTTVQSALDAVPSNSSVTNPHVLMVMPGVYKENITLYRDGVTILGVGNVLLQDALVDTPNAVGATSTLTVKASGGTIPLTAVLRNLHIHNPHNNMACVKFDGGAASTAGNGRILLDGCRFQADATGGNRYLWGTSVNDIEVSGGSFVFHALGLILMEEIHDLLIEGVRWVPALQLDYDSAGVIPSLVASPQYRILDCDEVAVGTGLATPISSMLEGASQLTIGGCRSVAALTLGGNRTAFGHSCGFGNLTINGTSKMSLTESTRGTAVGAGKLSESFKTGSAVFVAQTTKAVVFDVPFMDGASYMVTTEVDSRPVNDEPLWVTNKATTGFTINFQTVQTLTASWRALKV